MSKKSSRRRRKNRLVLLVVVILIVGLINLKKGIRSPFHKNTVSALSISKGLELIQKDNLLQNQITKRAKDKRLAQAKEEIEKAKEKKQTEENSTSKVSRKVAYLTFDDGPSVKSTPIILDVLKENNIKATFFVVGYMVAENPQLLKRAYDEGHQIGNHSYSHQYEYIYKSTENFMKDFYKAENLIKSIVGEEFDSKIMRFPGGSFEKKKDPMKKVISDSGYKYIDWNALNGDAEGKLFSEEYLVSRLKETVKGKNKVVILMHDTDAKITTANSLDKSIKFLLSEGYELDILDENFSWEK